VPTGRVTVFAGFKRMGVKAVSVLLCDTVKCTREHGASKGKPDSGVMPQVSRHDKAALRQTTVKIGVEPRDCRLRPKAGGVFLFLCKFLIKTVHGIP